LKIVMGVIDIPYVGSEPRKARAARLKKGRKAPKTERNAGNITTGDVAEILEAKYHPMEIYFEIHGQEVADKMTEGLVGTMENVLAGAPLSVDPFGDAEAFIDSGFKDFITTGEMEGLGYPGVPTKASIERKSARFKKGKSRKERPSFVDTGLYVDSSKSEIVG
jgi:hypothetical protein